MTSPAYEPPQEVVNVQVEQMVLAALLSVNEAYEKIRGRVHAADFSDDFNAALFELIARTIEDGKPATPTLLADHLPDGTPPNYLERLASSAMTMVDLEYHADYVHRLAQVRTVRGFCDVSLNELTGESRLDGFVEEAWGLLEDLRDDGPQRKQVIDVGAAAKSVVDTAVDIHDRRIAGTELPIISTGIKQLDRAIGGLRGGQLIVPAGSPGSGKSALALTIAYNIAFEHAGTDLARHVFYESLEMSEAELTERALARMSGIPTPQIANGMVSDHDISRLRDAEAELARMGLYIEDNGGATVSSIRLSALQARRKHGLDVIVVDYMQLMEGQGENRTLQVGSISRGLKQLAKELNVPVIALSQLSRQVNQRDGHVPDLGDLRESGSIEQDADIVIFVHNEAYWHAKKEPHGASYEHAEWETDQKKYEIEVDLIIGKNRQGPSGKRMTIGFDRATVSMHDQPAQTDMGL